jgi:hypothetical protein
MTDPRTALVDLHSPTQADSSGETGTALSRPRE